MVVVKKQANWTCSDTGEYDRLWDKITANEKLTEDEQLDFQNLMLKKYHTSAENNPFTPKFKQQLVQAITLVDDIKADGARLMPKDSADMCVLLLSAGDNMVERFSLIKKAGRRLIEQGDQK